MDNKRKKIENVLFVLLCGLIGFFVGLLGVFNFPDDVSLPVFLSSFIFKMILFLVSYDLHIIFHESGHLFAGLLTGYRFSSFRIGSLMLLKNQGVYSFKRYSLAGTGGQCLLIPPEKKSDGSYPYHFYHLGGILMNLFLSVIAFVLTYNYRFSGYLHSFVLFFGVSGVICFLTNGIPMRVGGVANDGYNVLHIGKEPFAAEAVWLQLKINELQLDGVRLKDMPDEWFVIPEHASRNNIMISTIAVFAENRAMDSLDLTKAKNLIRELESDSYSVIDLYMNMLNLDKITIDLIENKEDADVEMLNDKKFKSFMKTMVNSPSVIRTKYAVQLLKERNIVKAQELLKLFSRIEKSYPLKAEITSERSIIAYIDHCVE